MDCRSFELSSLEVSLPGQSPCAGFCSGPAGSVRRASHAMRRARRSNRLSAHGRATTMCRVATVKARNEPRVARDRSAGARSANAQCGFSHPQPNLQHSPDSNDIWSATSAAPMSFAEIRSPWTRTPSTRIPTATHAGISPSLRLRLGRSQALNRSTSTNLSGERNWSDSQCFSTGSRTGMPDSMSFCCSAMVTACARFCAPIFA